MTKTEDTRFREFITRAIKANPVEARITRKVVTALAGTNPIVKVRDSEGGYVRVSTVQDVLDQVFNLEWCYLTTADGAWVMLVSGNDYDMISDYTTDLEDALAPVNAWVEKNRD